MLNKSKKGFTIVELIIVIAVIAVLAAVLIPTFSNLIGKAQEAKDTALVRNLNEALAMDTSTSKHTTMEQAVAAVRNNGIDISKIKATVPGNAILWDSVNDLFAYYKVDKDGNASGVYYIPEYSANKPADGRLFAVISDVEAAKTSKYGVYYIGEDTTSITVNGVGLDAGSANIGEVVYQGSTNGATSDIRTNGGKLTVKNADKDEVYHYDTVLSVVIEEVKNNSYHECGTVEGNIEIQKGHVVVEKNATIGTIVVAPAESANVQVTSNGGSVGAVVKQSGVTANIDSKLTVTEISEAQKAEMENFAGGIGTEASPYLIENAEQFLKIGNFDDEMKKGKAFSFKLIADLTIDAVADLNNKPVTNYFSGLIQGDNHNITIKNNTNATEQILYLYPVGTAKISDIDFHITSDYIVTLTYGWSSGKTIFENVNFGSEEDNGLIYASDNNKGFYANFILGSAEFIGCTNYYSLYSNDAERYAAVFIGGYMNENANVSFVDCKNYGSVTMQFAGLFFGNAQGCTKNNLTIKKCYNFGNIIGTQASTALGGKNTNKANVLHELISSGLTGNEKFRTLSSEGLSVTVENDNLVITKLANAEADKYSVTFAVWATAYDNAGNKWGTRFTSVSVDLGNPNFVNDNFVTELRAYKIQDKATYTKDNVNSIPSDTKWLEKEDGIKYFFDNENKIIVVDYSNVKASTAQSDIVSYTVNSYASITVSVFDSNGEMLATATKSK